MQTVHGMSIFHYSSEGDDTHWDYVITMASAGVFFY